jgi:tetratricopeptide (TPR) repeat protein
MTVPISASQLPQTQIDALLALFASSQFARLEVQAQSLLQSFPQHGFLWKALSVALQAQGKEALQALAMTATTMPDDAEAHNNLGVALRAAGRLEDAAASHRRALVLRADYFESHYNLGVALRELKMREDALHSLHLAVALAPHHAQAYNDLGNTYRELERLHDAARCYLRAFAIDPALAEVHSNLGTVLRDLGRLSDAVDSFCMALQSNAEMAELHNNLGNALQESGLFTESLASFRRALILKPDFTMAHNNLAKVLRDLGDLDAAIVSGRRALQIQPEYAEARLNHAYFLLQQGDFASGWREYEYRWKIERAGRQRAFAQPLWLGESDLQDKTILLHAEQGLGDTLQFVRYVPAILVLGARVILEVQDEVFSLIEHSFVHPALQVVLCDQPLPPFDCQCPLLSLPLALDVMKASTPHARSYLRPNALLTTYWGDRVMERSSQRPKLRVGLVWAGSPRKYNLGAYIVDSMRSVSWAQMSTLLDVADGAGIEFYSLQVGADAATQLRDDARVIDLTPYLRDFQDTAALVAHLDLVISVDTSTAHLAAATGKPVWMLNRFNTCWRWRGAGESSEWYPTMRIFRQPRLGDWDSVLRHVAIALREFAVSFILKNN